MKRVFDVFLSYNRQDGAVVREICEVLRARQLRPWLYEEELPPGVSWQERLEEVLDEIAAAAVFVGPSGLGPWQNREVRVCLNRFVHRELPVIPVLLPGVAAEPALPPFLEGVTWVDLRGGIDRQGIDQLVWGITQEKPARPGPASSPPPPPIPAYPSEEVRRLSAELSAAYERLKEETVAGRETTAVQVEILGLKRQLREGGRLRPGDLLDGRLELLELLGQGGFAGVWKACDRQRHELTAVKVLHGQHAEDRSRRERFFRGAREMARLRHPNVVRVLEEKLEDGGHHFFVMEYLPGGDLRQAVLAGRLGPEAAFALLREVGEALEHAHRQGVIHRDVKPANILLDADGRPKLTDFDLVRAGDTTGGTRTGTALGTYVYAAPEALESAAEAGVAADLYSLAMTAVFCLYGKDLAAREVIWNRPAFLSGLRCPAWVREALGRALAVEPAERHGSIAELLAALDGEAGREEGPAGEGLPSRAAEILPPPERTQRDLVELVAGGLQGLAEEERRALALSAVEAALPLDPWRLDSLGAAAWLLDFFPGRGPDACERQRARELREEMLAPLWRRSPAPRPPRPGDPDWVDIPGGPFIMGSPHGAGHKEERPAQIVRVSPFRMLVHPVTDRQFRRLVPGIEREDLPAVGMSWYKAYAYAAWLGGRLPTEAEWEYAARADCPHPYGDRHGQEATLDQVGWYEETSGGKLHPVRQLEPNRWGLYDMIGNAWEWVAVVRSLSGRGPGGSLGPARGQPARVAGRELLVWPGLGARDLAGRRLPGPGDRAPRLPRRVPRACLRERQPVSRRGDLRCTRLPRGNGIEQAYDGAGRLVEVRRKPDCDPPTQALERTVYTLDDAGNRVLEDHQRWDGAAWVSEARTRYEHACHLNRVIHGSGGPEESVTEHCYDAADNLEQIWDGNHPRATNPTPTQRYTYDALNRLAAATQPWTGAGGGNAVTTYSYDVQDHLSAVTDAEGNTTTYTYSDRDLMTRQVSPVSGTTTYVYNEHGELTSQTDARGVTVTHEVDALDRVTRTDHAGEALDIDYTYDDPAVPFSRGRLTRSARDGGSIDYRYDRFGRMIQDAALSYAHDANGNRCQVTYPGGLTATYAHDFADRETTLTIDDGVNPPQPIVTAATYMPAGPLATLALGNGLQALRGFDARYAPTGIEVPGRLDWSYATDRVGNVTAIDDLLTPSSSRSFSYQDNHYFLTSADGPWGARDWVYDRIGNRLAEIEDGATYPYSYRLNPGGGHLPQLERIEPSPIRGRITYSFDAAGNQDRATATSTGGSTRNIFYTYDAESRLSGLRTSFGPASTALRFAGRPVALYALGNPLLYTGPLGLEPVHNGSDRPVPYKPETGRPGQVWLCMPGETCNADGVYPPACNDYPIKIVNGCAAEIDTAGRLIVRCPLIDLSARSLRESFSALGQLLTGGRTNNRFHAVHDDWRRPNGRLYCGCDPARPFSGPPPSIPPMTLP